MEWMETAELGDVEIYNPSTSGVSKTPKSTGRKSKRKKLSDPFLQSLLDQCSFYLTISHTSSNPTFFDIGKFYFDVLPFVDSSLPVVFPSIHACKNAFYLYVCEVDLQKSFLYYEENINTDKKVYYWSVMTTLSCDVLEGLKQPFQLSICEATVSSECTKMKIGVLLQLPNKVLNEDEISSFDAKVNPSVLKVLKFFIKDLLDERSCEAKVSWPLNNSEVFYDSIRNYHKRNQAQSQLINSSHVSSLEVKLKLRPYQAEAVQWMLHREKLEDSKKAKELHPLFIRMTTLDGQSIFVNKYNGTATSIFPPKKFSGAGGILADEMGLGKTIEVLFLILLSARPKSDFDEPYKFPSNYNDLPEECILECTCGSSGETEDYDYVQCCRCGLWQHGICFNYDVNHCPEDYLCPHCWVASDTIAYPSKTTLIVTPAAISYQWVEEIEKHLSENCLRWYIYDGVKRNDYVQPSVLASYDVVLTTYEIFRQEINYIDLPHPKYEGEKRLRHPKKFMTVPSPLTAIQWWRVCFDEAQMVESSHSKVAHLALRLSTINLWCVTGTPIQESVNDIFGLLVLLGEEPYCYKQWWKAMLFDPYCEGYVQSLITVMASCFRRTAKKDVLNQISIPAQMEEVHYLDFSPVEEYFYAREHERASYETTLKISNFSNKNLKLKDLERNTLTVVISPLLRLRLACCHPQIVTRGHKLPLRKKTMTMDEVLKMLLKDCKLECEEHHRQYISATNGLAGISIILGDIKKAVDLYRTVLQAEKEEAGNLKTDRCQIMHTLVNLANVLDDHIKPPLSDENCSESQPSENPFQIGRTLEDDKLRERAEELKSSYLNKCKELVCRSVDSLKKNRDIVMEITLENSSEIGTWSFAVIKQAEVSKQDVLYVSRIKEFLNDKLTQSKLCKTFYSLSGLKYIIVRELEKLSKARETLSEAVGTLSSNPSNEDVVAAVDCHLRPTGGSVKCKYCQIHELFNDYESCLFRFKEDTNSAEPMTSEDALLHEQRRGIWADSEMEMVLKCLHGSCKSLNCSQDVVEKGSSHLKLFDVYKKEFKAMRSVWINVRDFVSAIDEIEMSKLRLRVRYLDEPISDPPLPYVLDKSEVFSMSLQLIADQTEAETNLKKKKGRLLYLNTLSKSKFCKNGGFNTEHCPVCDQELGTKWAVIQCAHAFCNDCIGILGSMNAKLSIPFVRCPVCRQETTHDEINFVNSESEIDSNEDSDIQGSYSTKIVGVLRCLKNLRDKEPKAKVLVFSFWQRLLDIVSDALSVNSIHHLHIADKKGFQVKVKRFKKDPEMNVLLLPIKSGANGLNLIEATHVLFVEPLLNSGAEQQALGRVHRIGQTKRTTFHRFIVRGTIEERIYNLLKSTNTSNSTKDDKEMTLNELSELFQTNS